MGHSRMVSWYNISRDHADTMILGSALASIPLPLKVYEHVSLLFISKNSVSEQFISKQMQSSHKIQKNYKPSNNYSAFTRATMKACLPLLAWGSAEKNHSELQASTSKLLPGLLPTQLSTLEQSQFSSLHNTQCPTSAVVMNMLLDQKATKSRSLFYLVPLCHLHPANHFLHNFSHKSCNQSFHSSSTQAEVLDLGSPVSYFFSTSH